MDTRFRDIKFHAENSEINLKNNIIDISILKTHCLFDELKKFIQNTIKMYIISIMFKFCIEDLLNYFLFCKCRGKKK